MSRAGDARDELSMTGGPPEGAGFTGFVLAVPGRGGVLEQRARQQFAEARRGWVYRQRGEDGDWSEWSLATLGIPSLIAKGQDRDDYEVEEVVVAADVARILEGVFAWRGPGDVEEFRVVAYAREGDEAPEHVVPSSRLEGARELCVALRAQEIKNVQRYPDYEPYERIEVERRAVTRWEVVPDADADA